MIKQSNYAFKLIKTVSTCIVVLQAMYSLPLATLVAVLVALATHVHQVSCQLDDEYNILSRQLRPKVYLKRFTKLYCKSTKESLVNFEECFASYYERIFDHVYRKHEMDDARAMVAYCFKASSPMARREKQCKKNKMKADYGMDKVRIPSSHLMFTFIHVFSHTIR